MSALHKLKAYFGMVPAEDDYDFDDYRRGYGDDGYDDHDDVPYQQSRRQRPRYHVMDEFEETGSAARQRHRYASNDAAVQGSLAMDRQPDQVTRLRPAPEPARPARDPLSRIVTLHPTSYGEAREIGEAYREGAPVIMNLTEMDNADAKRLVDFAAGLAFALHGSMDKVTNKVFLLSPPDADVTAEDRKRIAEGGMFLRD